MQGNIADNNRKVATWLLACCALVFIMVVLGGVTRLTGSGLSMVDWRPLLGALPPMSDEAWQKTFEMYQQTPEFAKVNTHMEVDDFKGIFWLEYLHRLLGRTIGIVFLIPFLVFAWRGYIRKQEWSKYSLMFVLGGNYFGLLCDCSRMNSLPIHKTRSDSTHYGCATTKA